MVLLQAVRDWHGPRPSELALCAPEDDLTWIVALKRAEMKMAAWEHKLQADKMKKAEQQQPPTKGRRRRR